MKQKNYYDILGVSETAGESEIKTAYRKLAKECHPDRNPGDAAAEARFKDISEAYEVLSSAEKRRKYDELRRYSSGAAPEGMSFDDFMSRFGGERTGDAREFTWGFGGGLEEIFATLFGGRSGAGRSERSGRRSRSPGAAWDSTERQAPHAPTDPFFRREGVDAWVEIPVNPAQLLLGSAMRVRTPDGARVLVRIRQGTQPEAVLRVPRHGYTDGRRTGDLYIRLRLTLPSALTEDQKDAVRALAARMGWKH